MNSKHILSMALSLILFCTLVGCTGSDDLEPTVTSGSSQSESEQSEVATTSETGSQTEAMTSEIGSQTEAITSKAAETIALNDVGITESDVKYIHSYEEHDGGTIVAWCVEFEVGNTQYSYYVDMYTGEILRSFVERHD